MRVTIPLLLLFIALPLTEIYLFAHVGERIGALATVGMVLLTAVVGLALIRIQGMGTIQRAQHTLQQGGLPAIEMLEGMLLLLAGLLLLVPGFFTDTIGFLFLIPPLRRAIIHLFVAKNPISTSPPPSSSSAKSSPKGPYTIEGEWHRED